MAVTVTFGSDTYGTGQDWDIDGEAGGIGGLWSVAARVNNFDRTHADGSVKGPAYKGPAVVTIPLILAVSATVTEALNLLESLKVTWEPLQGTDITSLTIAFDDRTYSMVGAPEGLDVPPQPLLLTNAFAQAMCTFTVHDAAISVGGP